MMATPIIDENDILIDRSKFSVAMAESAYATDRMTFFEGSSLIGIEVFVISACISECVRQRKIGSG